MLRPVLAGAVAGVAALVYSRTASPAVRQISDGSADNGDPFGAWRAIGYQLANSITLGSSMHMSARGLKFLQDLEGFSPTPYRDADGQSIGFGHFIRPGESFTRITREEGAALLRADVADAEEAVTALVSVDLTQSQYDALVSFVYNAGEGGFRSSTLRKRINAGDITGAASEFSRWVYTTRDGEKVRSAALVDRRAKEAALFRGQA